MAFHQAGHEEACPSHRLCKGEDMYQRWPGLTLDNAVPVSGDKLTRVPWGVKLIHGRARQASGTTNSPTRDARPPLRARMGSPWVGNAAWLAFLVVISTGAPGWVCGVAFVAYAAVELFGVSPETKTRRRSHSRPIGAHPDPDEGNHDNRSSRRTAEDGARPSASLARPPDGAPGAVAARPAGPQPPDDDELTRTPGVRPTRPRLRWSALRSTRDRDRPPTEGTVRVTLSQGR